MKLFQTIKSLFTQDSSKSEKELTSIILQVRAGLINKKTHPEQLARYDAWRKKSREEADVLNQKSLDEKKEQERRISTLTPVDNPVATSMLNMMLANAQKDDGQSAKRMRDLEERLQKESIDAEFQTIPFSKVSDECKKKMIEMMKEDLKSLVIVEDEN